MAITSGGPVATLRRGQPIPLYHRLYLSLRDEIVAGVRPFGSTLTEQEVAALAGVSRITAQRAFAELAADGLVERRRRIGTRVIFRSPAKPIEADLEQTVEALIAFGRETQVQVDHLATEPATAMIAGRLGLATGDLVVHAVRRRLLRGEPLGLVTSHMPQAMAAGVDRRSLLHTPLLSLLIGAGHIVGGGHQTVSAVTAGADLAEILAITPGAPVLRIERIVLDPAGRPLLATTADYRADRYRLSLDFHPPGITPAADRPVPQPRPRR